MKKFRSVLTLILIVLFVFIGFLALFSAMWCSKTYGDIGFDAILFTLFSNLTGVSTELVVSYLKYAIPPTVLCTAAVCFILLFKPKKKLEVSVKNFKLALFPFKRVFSLIVAIVIFSSLTITGANKVKAFDYISYQLNPSDFIEKEYVDPKEVNIAFPENKRNLVYIFMESMETSFFSKELGGGLDYNVIPELYSLAENNINFSGNANVGGSYTVPGATWTMGGLLAETSGLPLRLPIRIANNMVYRKNFFPSVSTLTDILKENGYRQSFMCGSDIDFGGRKQYFEQHGALTIYDYNTAQKDGIIPEGYWDEFWGMEDHHLYDYAKQELPKIAEGDDPFAFFMLTVDTHHISGNLCEKCGNEYDEQYENVYSCASKQVDEFIKWIQAQDFYENTTVIIVGDHKSMDSEYFDRNFSDDYVRKIYNCFINSAVESPYTKNRNFTQLDIFPTTLASLGCSIEGERLGLGVNLFSGKETLAEKYGIKEMQAEIKKKSKMYDDELMQIFNDK